MKRVSDLGLVHMHVSGQERACTFEVAFDLRCTSRFLACPMVASTGHRGEHAKQRLKNHRQSMLTK